MNLIPKSEIQTEIADIKIPVDEVLLLKHIRKFSLRKTICLQSFIAPKAMVLRYHNRKNEFVLIKESTICRTKEKKVIQILCKISKELRYHASYVKFLLKNWFLTYRRIYGSNVIWFGKVVLYIMLHIIDKPLEDFAVQLRNDSGN